MLGRVEDARDPARLLLVGAPRDDRRPDLHDAVRVVDARRAVLRHHLRVDHRLRHRWRRDRRHSSGHRIAAQRPSFSLCCHALRFSIAPMTPRDGFGVVAVGPLIEERAHLLVEERFEFLLERAVLGRPGKVHEADISVMLPVPFSGVDFTFSPEQEQLRASVRAFLIAEAPKAYVRQMAEHDDAGITPDGVERRSWNSGGRVCSFPNATVASASESSTRWSCKRRWGVSRSPGRTSPRQSSPRSRRAHSASTSDSLHSPAGKNEARSRSTKPATGDPLERVRVRADGRGNSYRLDGVKPMVMDAHSADWVLVPARTREGLRTFCVDGRRRAARAEPRHHSQVRARRVRRHGRAAGRPGRRPDGPVATRARRRGCPARGRDDRRRRGRQRARARLRPSADRVRQAAVEVPSDAAQGRRHAPPDRDGEGRRALRGVGIGCRRTRSRVSRGDGEIVHARKLRTTSPRNASRSTAASGTRGTATPTSSCGAQR